MNGLDPIPDPNDAAIAAAWYRSSYEIRARYADMTIYGLMERRDAMDAMPVSDKLAAIVQEGWLRERLILGQMIRERRVDIEAISGKLVDLVETAAAIPRTTIPNDYKPPEEH